MNLPEVIITRGAGSKRRAKSRPTWLSLLCINASFAAALKNWQLIAPVYLAEAVVVEYLQSLVVVDTKSLMQTNNWVYSISFYPNP
jgi:hypothetical protein